MASTTPKVMHSDSWKTMPLQPTVASQMVRVSYKFSRSSSSSNVTCNATTSSDHLETVHSMSHEGTPYDPSAIVRVLIPISIAGWLLFGIICILCINGRGKLGRWIPEWYLDSDGTVRDKAMVVLWWLAVMLLWPVILPALLVRKAVRLVKRWMVKSRTEARMLWPRECMEEEV